MNPIVNQLHELALEATRSLDAADFTVRGAYKIELAFQPSVGQRFFRYDILVVQVLRNGACYRHANGSSSEADRSLAGAASLIGQDARFACTRDRDMHIATLDALYGSIPGPSAQEFTLTGSSREKSAARARIIVDEVAFRLSQKSLQRKPRVLLVGVVSALMKQLVAMGCEVIATDLDPAIVGTVHESVLIRDGREHNLLAMSECDVALVTGMTLATDTLADLLTAAKEADTKVVMFNETGAWFGQALCDHLGVDSVVAEPFPFYVFDGANQIRLHRRS